MNSASTSPHRMSIICCTSAQVTALMPPSDVYVTTSAPISTVVSRSGHPRITDSTTAGA